MKRRKIVVPLLIAGMAIVLAFSAVSAAASGPHRHGAAAPDATDPDQVQLHQMTGGQIQQRLQDGSCGHEPLNAPSPEAVTPEEGQEAPEATATEEEVHTPIRRMLRDGTGTGTPAVDRVQRQLMDPENCPNAS